jgi:outer membrane protein assembly factor BamB
MRGLLLSLTVATWVSGCGFFGGSAKKPLPLPELAGNVLKAAWQASTAKSQGFAFSPAVSDGNVYVAGADGTISVFDEASGRLVRRIDANDRLTAGVGVAQNLVAVANGKGEVLAFHPDGRLLWKVSVAGEVLSPPEVAPASVIVRTSDGRVVALATADGKRKWVYTRPTPSLTLRSAAGVIITRGEVVLGFPGGRVIALDQDTGKLLAEYVVSNPRGASELERVTDVAGVPYLEEKRLCAVTFQGRAACFDPANGSTLWARDASSSAGLAADGKYLYVTLADGTVQAMAKDSGASVWKNDRLIHRRLSAPLAAGAGVLVGDHLGFVHLLTQDGGALAGRLATDGSAVHAIVPMGNNAVVQTAAGGVFALRL